MAGYEGFALGGVRFRNLPLPPEEALRVFDLLIEKVLPVAAVAFGSERDEGKLFAQLARAAGALPEVQGIFAKHSEWAKPPSGGWVSVAQFPEVFARRPSLLVGWISRSLKIEFADFFGEDGRALVGAAANDWRSLVGSIGESGDS
jgi:hypothetical protein